MYKGWPSCEASRTIAVLVRVLQKTRVWDLLISSTFQRGQLIVWKGGAHPVGNTRARPRFMRRLRLHWPVNRIRIVVCSLAMQLVSTFYVCPLHSSSHYSSSGSSQSFPGSPKSSPWISASYGRAFLSSMLCTVHFISGFQIPHSAFHPRQTHSSPRHSYWPCICMYLARCLLQSASATQALLIWPIWKPGSLFLLSCHRSHSPRLSTLRGSSRTSNLNCCWCSTRFRYQKRKERQYLIILKLVPLPSRQFSNQLLEAWTIFTYRASFYPWNPRGRYRMTLWTQERILATFRLLLTPTNSFPFYLLQHLELRLKSIIDSR